VNLPSKHSWRAVLRRLFPGRCCRACGAWLIDQYQVSTDPRSGMTADFQWQAGYGVFAVSQSLVPTVRQYIQNQEEHHTKQTFQDELRILLRKHEIAFDERYVWD
jgi:hypothetical protein